MLLIAPPNLTLTQATMASKEAEFAHSSEDTRKQAELDNIPAVDDKSDDLNEQLAKPEQAFLTRNRKTLKLNPAKRDSKIL